MADISESETLRHIKSFLEAALREVQKGQSAYASSNIRNALGSVNTLQKQLGRGVHKNNPGLLAVYGNPGVVCLSRGEVQCIVYGHARRDVGPRAHGFGDAPIRLATRGNTLSISNLADRTGVSMFGSEDKKQIIVRGDRGQKLWDYFPEGT